MRARARLFDYFNTVFGMCVSLRWANEALMWFYTPLEHICGDKNEAKRDLMELKKYQL